MGNRDPRVQPTAGDVVRNPDGVTFHVRHATCAQVAYQEQGVGEILICDLEEWRTEAASDVVVERGADE
jgi:hypothetical protein